MFTLIDQDQALDRLCDLLRENALRAAAFQPEGVNQHTPDFLRCDAPYSLTPVELEAAESRRAPLYARQVAEIERAERHADREARRLRAALAVAFAPDNDLVTPFPPEVQTPNRTAYRDALLDLRREAKTGFSGEMIEPVSLACDASGYNVSCLYCSRARRGLVTDKRYTERRLQADRPVLDQLPDYLTRRGYGLRLQASGGDTFEITHKTRGFADHWAERQRAAGHTVIAWEQIASLERPATPDERRALEAKEAARRERARDRARSERARAGQETRLDQLPRMHALRNAALGLQEFTGYRMEGDALIDADTGQTVRERATAHDLATAWAGALVVGGETVTFAVPRERGNDEQEAQPAPVANAKTIDSGSREIRFSAVQRRSGSDRDRRTLRAVHYAAAGQAERANSAALVSSMASNPTETLSSRADPLSAGKRPDGSGGSRGKRICAVAHRSGAFGVDRLQSADVARDRANTGLVDPGQLLPRRHVALNPFEIMCDMGRDWSG